MVPPRNAVQAGPTPYQGDHQGQVYDPMPGRIRRVSESN
jgi:hypothetical protein